MNGVISAILVGILKSVGWEKLIVRVLEDMFYLAAKKSGIEVVEKVATRVGDALKEAQDSKEK